MTLDKDEIRSIVTSASPLKHYGVRGMHWGTKKGKHLSEQANKAGGTGGKQLVKGTVKSVKNAVRHPVHTVVARAKHQIFHPIFSQTSPIQSQKLINASVDKAVAKKKARKAAQDASWKEYKKESVRVGGKGVAAGAKAGAVGLKNAGTHYKTTAQEATNLRRESGRNYSKGGGVAAQKILNDRVEQRLKAQKRNRA